MLTYTENEIAMIKAFWDESIGVCGACDENENMSYMNAKDLQEVLGGSMQHIGGTMSSLEGKGAIVDTMESPRGARLNDFMLCDRAVIDITNKFSKEL